MTVAELIKELEKMPQDKPVTLNGSRNYTAEGVFYNEDWDCITIVD